MNIPHKWPGKKKIVVMCAYMKMIDPRPLDHQQYWNMIAGTSGNILKKCYSGIRYNMRVVVELHEKSSTQRGKDNG